MLRLRNRSIIKYLTSSYYHLLDAEQDSSMTEIKQKYLRKLKETHPDAQEGNHNKFLQLQTAYNVLSHPIRRKAYDISIGIQIHRWETELHTWEGHQQFQSEEIDKVLDDQYKERARGLSAYQNLCQRYRDQCSTPQSIKQTILSLALPMCGFCLLWVSWQFVEMFLGYYQGNQMYSHSVSSKGKDFSIFVAQIR